jgi:hypothetical protein
VPTSVLLAVLAAAGLLALAPALVRRYDATERLAAERAQSTARVLDRTRRRRTVPTTGRPVRPPAIPADAPLAASTDSSPARSAGSARTGSARSGSARSGSVRAGSARSGDEQPRLSSPLGRAVWLPLGAARTVVTRTTGSTSSAPAGARPGSTRGTVRRTTRVPAPRDPSTAAARRRAPAHSRGHQSPAVYRRRRVLALLIALNLIELIGVAAVSAGFWSGFAVTMLLLIAYVAHLRNRAINEARIRKVQARRTARMAAEQAAIRATHARRLAARKEALRRAAAARATAQRDAQRLSQRYVDFDPKRGARVRGRSYEQGGGYDGRAVG